MLPKLNVASLEHDRFLPKRHHAHLLLGSPGQSAAVSLLLPILLGTAGLRAAGFAQRLRAADQSQHPTGHHRVPQLPLRQARVQIERITLSETAGGVVPGVTGGADDLSLLRG